MNKTAFWLMLTGVVVLSSCNSDPIDKDNSIFDTTPPNRTEFDNWLLENYVKPYNIEFKYKFEDIESDYNYHLTPAKVEKSIILAQVVKKVWLESYDEVAGPQFTKSYAPRLIYLVGSGAYNGEGSVVLGTAEGGLKVTLYLVNNLQTDPIVPEDLNFYYFHTMHHEFGHILHQTIAYDPAFKLISNGKYVSGDWIYEARKGDSEAQKQGFISAYAMNQADDDFVETYSFYVTYSKEWWRKMLVTAGAEEEKKDGNLTGELILKDGALTISNKLESIRTYFQNVWNIDIDEMRDVILRRSDEAIKEKFLTFK
jgi:substrate import-associated zinc metallohydrolase lipoprotein